jgi:vacuolar-type H+-ATPase subunit D/Vma8
MAVKPHEVMKEKTAALADAFYELLRRSDDYRKTLDDLLEVEHGSTAPRQQLIHRL